MTTMGSINLTLNMFCNSCTCSRHRGFIVRPLDFQNDSLSFVMIMDLPDVVDDGGGGDADDDLLPVARVHSSSGASSYI